MTRPSLAAIAASTLACSLLLSACGEGGGSSPQPTAVVGPAQTVGKGAQVTLDGSASTDPGGATLSYRWSQVAGAPVVLDRADVARPTFVAPHASGTLGFTLVVSNGAATSPAATVQVTVVNQRPQASLAGPGSALAGSVVTLDGRASRDADGDALTYLFAQTSGPAVALADGVPGTSRFTAPAVAAPTAVTFALSVSDGEAASIEDASWTVTVYPPGSNLPPTASAGPDQVVGRSATVILAGAGVDPEAQPLTYGWAQLDGPAVALDAPSAAVASFTAPAVECDLTFQLSVSDGISTATDPVIVHVRNQAPEIAGVTLSPAAPRTQDDLTATAVASDPDGDPIALSYRWTRNGAAVDAVAGAVFPNGLTTRGDVIAVTVTAFDGTASASADASVTILDAPPVLAFSAPAQVAHGATVSFRATASDPDGDAVPAIELAHGPAGMAVAADGTVTWTAHGPMFARALDVHFGLVMEGVPDSLVAGTIQVTDPARPEPLLRTSLGRPTSGAALRVADLDGDGRAEILVGSANGLYEAARAGDGYAQRWAHPFAPGEGTAVQAVAVADVDGDGRPEIFFASEGAIVALDGATRRERARYDGGANFRCSDLRAADLEPDGKLEVVCLIAPSPYLYGSNTKLLVLDAATLTKRWETAELAQGGSAMAVGNVDGDPALEIVTAGGYVFDGRTQANEWAYSAGFGTRVEVGDLDGDGVAEIVGMPSWTAFRGYSAVLKSPVWEVSRSNPGALAVADLNGDEKAEVLIGDAQWGNVTAYEYAAATNKLTAIFDQGSQGSVLAIGVGDVDGDGKNEVVWSGSTSLYGETGGSGLFVGGLDPSTTIEWRSGSPAQLDPPFVGGILAHPRAGGTRLLFAVGRTNGGYAGARILALDPATGTVEVSAEVGSNWNRTTALDVADFDRDGVDEALLATANLYDGYFTAYDLSRAAADWTSPTFSNEAGVAVAHGDLNGDGYQDAVTMTGAGVVRAYDLHGQAVLWTSTSLGSGAALALAVADLGRGQPDIVALAGSRAVVYTRASGVVGYVEAGSHNVASPLDIAVADCDGDGAPEIYVLGSTGTEGLVLRLDTSLNLLGSFTVGPGASGLAVEDLGFGRKNLLLSASASSGNGTAGATSTLRAIDARTGAEVWRSPAVLGAVSPRSLWLADANGDGELELAFGTSAGMYVTR